MTDEFLRYSEVYREGEDYVLDQAVFEDNTEYIVMHRSVDDVFEFEADKVQQMLGDAEQR